MSISGDVYKYKNPEKYYFYIKGGEINLSEI